MAGKLEKTGKNVGLLTIHRIHNFGSALQTLATLRLVEAFGFRGKLIDYQYPAAYHEIHASGSENTSALKKIVKKAAAFLGLLKLISRLQMIAGGEYRAFTESEKKFRKFLREMPSTAPCGRKTVSRMKDSFDVYLTGSDQTWNPRYLFRDYTFLLDFVAPGKRKISYSSSFGAKEIAPGFREDYAFYLKQFEALSVREQSGVPLVRDLTGKNALHCVDPTLLLTADDWRKEADYSACPEKPFLLCYILDYVFQPYPYVLDLISYVQKTLGLEVFVLTNRRNRQVESRGFVCHYDLGPREFLGLYDKAAFVISTSFHGTAFSVNFRKSFIAVTNPNASADDRVTDFLNTMHLNSAGVKAFSGTPFESIPLTTDYTETEPVLKDLLSKSADYLRQALEGQIADEKSNRLCEKTLCTGCAACADSCAFQAISMVQDDEGFRYPEIRQELCKSCGACTKACHILNPPEKNPVQSPVYAVWAKDKKFRLNSASGGVASVFSDAVLSRGGFVTGVVFDENFHAGMKLMESAEEIRKSRSSKYVEAVLDRVFRDTLEKLKAGKEVLFIGLPCHAAAVKTFVPENLQTNLTTVELICHGVPSAKAWDFYFRQQKEKFPGKTVTDFLFRKPEAWKTCMTFCFSDGSYGELKKSSYLSAFMKGFLFRESCFHCPYAAKERVGDLTIGDFWMYPAPRDGGGVSYLSVNTAKGGAFFEALRDRFSVHADKWENAVKDNANLIRPSKFVEERKTFYRDFYDMPESEILEKYHLYPNSVEKILSIPGRAARKILRQFR